MSLVCRYQFHNLESLLHSPIKFISGCGPMLSFLKVPVCLLFSLIASASSEILYRAEYVYDLRGLVTNLVEEYGGISTIRELEYDRRRQLVSEKMGAYQVQYEYDSLGNRIRQNHSGEEQVFSYNVRNELLQQQLPGSTRNLSYDLNGSLTQKVEGVHATRYEWDSRGRLLQVSTNGTEVFQASYAGMLNRQRKIEGSSFKHYRHDGSTVIEEIDESGALKELMRGDRSAPTVGGILYSADGEGTNTYSYNGVGSTVVLSPDDGPAKTIHYGAFGTILEADEGVETERLANTKERDASTGLYYHGARYYDAGIGRYISLDPAGDGVNHYIYAYNSPLHFVDPTGLQSVDWDDDVAVFVDNFLNPLQKNLPLNLTREILNPSTPPVENDAGPPPAPRLQGELYDLTIPEGECPGKHVCFYNSYNYFFEPLPGFLEILNTIDKYAESSAMSAECSRQGADYKFKINDSRSIPEAFDTLRRNNVPIGKLTLITHGDGDFGLLFSNTEPEEQGPLMSAAEVFSSIREGLQNAEDVKLCDAFHLISCRFGQHSERQNLADTLQLPIRTYNETVHSSVLPWLRRFPGMEVTYPQIDYETASKRAFSLKLNVVDYYFSRAPRNRPRFLYSPATSPRSR